MEQMRTMSLFEKVTGAAVRDCIEDEKHDRTIFVVDSGKMGLAIGRGGMHRKSLSKMLKRNVEFVEFSDDPAKFLANLFSPGLVSEVQINKRDDGSKAAVIMADPRKKGLVLGRDGKNIERARALAKRHFDIGSVMVSSPERATLEL